MSDLRNDLVCENESPRDFAVDELCVVGSTDLLLDNGVRIALNQHLCED